MHSTGWNNAEFFLKGSYPLKNCKLTFAVRPNIVTNCTFHTLTRDNTQLLEIRCMPGYNGGLVQNFHLEINRQNRTIANLSSASLPEFRIELSKFIEEWQSDLRFVIYSSNTKGRSEAVVLEHTIPKDLQIKMGM